MFLCKNRKEMGFWNKKFGRRHEGSGYRNWPKLQEYPVGSEKRPGLYRKEPESANLRIATSSTAPVPALQVKAMAMDFTNLSIAWHLPAVAGPLHSDHPDFGRGFFGVTPSCLQPGAPATQPPLTADNQEGGLLRSKQLTSPCQDSLITDSETRKKHWWNIPDEHMSYTWDMIASHLYLETEFCQCRIHVQIIKNYK
jgi:hypothetical protein